MIVSLMGCGSSNKKSNKTMRVGVVTYTADDPFINAMIEKVKSQLKTMETTNMNVIVSVRYMRLPAVPIFPFPVRFRWK